MWSQIWPHVNFFKTFHKSFYEKKIWIKHMELIALETRRKLGRVNFRIDFWDCYHPEKKKLANSWLVPRKNCGKHFSSSSLLLCKVVNKKITWLYINLVWLLEITRKVVTEPLSYTCCLERWAGVSACYKTTEKRYSYRKKVRKQVFRSFLCWTYKGHVIMWKSL